VGGVSGHTTATGRNHHLGRETFLAPVRFSDDGWPTIGERGQVELEMPAPELAPHRFVPLPARDDFDGGVLDSVWVNVRNPPEGAISLKQRAGHLRLCGQPASLDDIGPIAFVARRQQHLAMGCKTELDFAPEQPAKRQACRCARARIFTSTWLCASAEPDARWWPCAETVVCRVCWVVWRFRPVQLNCAFAPRTIATSSWPAKDAQASY